jgi:5-histidylcysteine sulfoxide synthase/putative 4-mercaptohistidine N1-methyltranferase
MSGSRNPKNLFVIATAPGAHHASAESKRNLEIAKHRLEMLHRAEWWTGLSPSDCPGFSAQEGKLHSLTIPNLAVCSRQEVRDYFNNTWTLTELLFSSLKGDEPFYRPPYHGLRHPLIFYYVHPAVLYINKLRISGLHDSAIVPHYESLFETGVDEMSWDDMSNNVIEWPSVDDALKYRSQAYAAVLSVIDSHPDLAVGHRPILQDHPLWTLFMGFEHERIHLETSSVLIRELPVEFVSDPKEWPSLSTLSTEPISYPPVAGLNYPENDFAQIPAGKVDYGKLADWPCYGWDNEYGKRSVILGAFLAGQLLISNGEFWQFVSAGGYHEAEHWTETGWRWRSFRNSKCPTFWVPDGPDGSHQYKLRTCFEIVPMQWDWPALVNYHEAKAFAKWKSAQEHKTFRLLTEAEHQALRAACNFSNLDAERLMVPPVFNINLKYGCESAVDAASISGAEICDLFGNVWQWCEDHFNPLPGSRVHRFYDDFSTPCYDGEHQMILGGSFVSTGDEATPWARYHFRPHFFQHAGFRLVQAPDGGDGSVARIAHTSATASPYDSQDMFNEYMTLHFAPAALQMPYSGGPHDACSFPQRIADLVSEWCGRLSIKRERALDVGCAVGGASFRLAESFEQVIGVDLCERSIKAAKQLKQNHELDFSCKVEANLYSNHKATVSAHSAQRVDFRQADACALPAEYTDFDAVLIANLLCRLPSPGACLSRMWGSRGIVAPGGILVTVSPYTWMDRFTPPDVWLGGYVDENGKECFSEDGLKRMLLEHFELLDTQDMPLIIREHRRKYQYICYASDGMASACYLKAFSLPAIEESLCLASL